MKVHVETVKRRELEMKKSDKNIFNLSNLGEKTSRKSFQEFKKFQTG